MDRFSDPILEEMYEDFILENTSLELEPVDEASAKIERLKSRFSENGKALKKSLKLARKLHKKKNFDEAIAEIKNAKKYIAALLKDANDMPVDSMLDLFLPFYNTGGEDVAAYIDGNERMKFQDRYNTASRKTDNAKQDYIIYLKRLNQDTDKWINQIKADKTRAEKKLASKEEKKAAKESVESVDSAEVTSETESIFEAALKMVQ